MEATTPYVPLGLGERRQLRPLRPPEPPRQTARCIDLEEALFIPLAMRLRPGPQVVRWRRVGRIAVWILAMVVAVPVDIFLNAD